MTRNVASGGRVHGVGVVALVHNRAEDWADSLISLKRLLGTVGEQISIACTDLNDARRCLTTEGVDLLDEWTLSAASARVFEDAPGLAGLLVLTAPVAVPPNLLDRGLAWLNDDPRIATVSFLSNAAGPFSVPHLNTPTPYPLKGLDETSATTLLRASHPDSGPVPITAPAGSAVLINRASWVLLGGFDPELDPAPQESLCEFALRSSRRGFQHRLDASTYVTAQWYPGFPSKDATADPEMRHHLHVRDSSFPRVHDFGRDDPLSPQRLALDVARAKLTGLRILLDAECLGPLEMGTQVQTIQIIRALAEREDVSFIGIGTQRGDLPSYAHGLLIIPKVHVYKSENMTFEGADYVDILHRPFQPDRDIPWRHWRSIAKRTVVTIQDLIAYRIGAYHHDGDQWLSYRRQLNNAMSAVDAVVAISEDTKAAIIEERLGISPDRIHVVFNGCDHLIGSRVDSIPSALLEHDMSTTQFLLVLGTTYAHKNRDLAIRTWQELRRRGHQYALIMAGASVVLGSSRRDEALARIKGGDEDLIVLPDVTSAERNWLLKHASLVLYPTMAEGFGLIPFEAAAFGTPTVFVRFGPFRETVSCDWLPHDWSVTGVANFCEHALTDADFRVSLVNAIEGASSRLTWEQTAARLVEVYRAALSCRPA